MILVGKENYTKLTHLLDGVNFNHLFARSVVDQTVNGRVYVDDINNPRTSYIVHNYGMSLLIGDHTNAEFSLAFRQHALNVHQNRTSHEWMQVFPDHWNNVLNVLLKDSLINAEDNKLNITKSVIERNTRVNFIFNKNAYIDSRKERINTSKKIKIFECTEDVFCKTGGSVIPSAFWNSYEDFRQKGIGYSLYYEGKLAATSFSSFLAPGKLELGIETLAEYRGKGLAEIVCAALIDHCIKRNVEPVWACRLENTGSYKLARKLGFTPSIELPYYRLSN
jgi:hypothetical protein